MSYSESGIRNAVFFRDAHAAVALFWRWEHKEVALCLISAKECLIKD